MVVYLPSTLAHKPVLASFLQGGSEDTLSVSKGSSKGLVRPDPLLYLGFWRVDRPGQSVALSLDLAPKIATALDCGIEDLLEEVEG